MIGKKFYSPINEIKTMNITENSFNEFGLEEIEITLKNNQTEQIYSNQPYEIKNLFLTLQKITNIKKTNLINNIKNLWTLKNTKYTDEYQSQLLDLWYTVFPDEKLIFIDDGIRTKQWIKIGFQGFLNNY
jgi:hypothetical protein